MGSRTDTAITLMHKDIPVASFAIRPETGRITDELAIAEPEHLPLPVCYGSDPTGALSAWIHERSIPQSRQDLDALLATYQVETPEALSFRHLGLNLSDQYWFRPTGSALTYSEVNLFENDFEPLSLALHRPSSVSPDSSSNGALRKYWRIEEDGTRQLCKAGSRPYDQQPYNERLASLLLARLAVPHVPYDLHTAQGEAYSSCPTFLTTKTEYIPAADIRACRPKRSDESALSHYRDCERSLGIKEDTIDTMLSFDYLIQNTDRHFGNFGFIRDADTLDFLASAPLFDHGNSLWYDRLTKDMKFSKQEAKPFQPTQDRQLKLVRHIPLPLERLTDDFLETSVREVYADNPHFDTERTETLIQRLEAARDYLLSQKK